MPAAIAVMITSRKRRSGEGIPSERHQPGARISLADNVIAISQEAGTSAGIEYRGSPPGNKFTTRKGTAQPQVKARNKFVSRDVGNDLRLESRATKASTARSKRVRAEYSAASCPA